MFEPVDILSGGFPCQDVSSAGKRAGIAGSRSGLWREMVRAIRLVRPRITVVENVAALLNRGMGTVCGDLAEIGLDAEWDCISAAATGAPHVRDRVFVLAYAARQRRQTGDHEGVILGEAPAAVPHHWHRGCERDFRGSSGRVFRAPRAAFERVAYGLPGELDRLRATGNSVSPPPAEWIGRSCVRFLGHAG